MRYIWIAMAEKDSAHMTKSLEIKSVLICDAYVEQGFYLMLLRYKHFKALTGNNECASKVNP